MEFSDRIRTESRPRLRQEEELPASEISFVWPGVPQFTWGAGPCPCREPGCQGDHGDRPGPPGQQTSASSRCPGTGPSLWTGSKPEATDIWDLDTRWGCRWWKQGRRRRRPWWPPDRGRGRHDAHLASTASQAPASTCLWQVSWYDPVQIHHALVYGGSGTTHWSSTALWKPEEVIPQQT